MSRLSISRGKKLGSGESDQVRKKLPDVIGNLNDPESFACHLLRFYEWCQIQQYTKATLHTWVAVLRQFTQWSIDRGVDQPRLVTYPMLTKYQRHLYYYRKANGEPLSTYSQNSKIAPVKSFFRWLTREHYILFNPASELQLPRRQRSLPRAILSLTEIANLLSQTDINDPYGIRDRAIMEVLYSTGIRRMEVVNLKLHDVDHQLGTVFIYQGKGQKDRVVPIGDRALAWVKKYQNDVRPTLMICEDDYTLFLNQYGEKMSMDALSRRVRVYMKAAEIDKPGSCHLFRHSMATHMLENGADIRYIQELLGHAKLDTTQIYTQVSIKKLKAIHEATHPAKFKKLDSLDFDSGDELNHDEQVLLELLNLDNDEPPCS
jgi:integrase/recombinase XerD